jgi:hypothetical protein
MAAVVLCNCQENAVEFQRTVEACCQEEFALFAPSDTIGALAYITGVRLLPLDRDGDHIFHTCHLKSQVVFWVQAEYKMIDAAEVPNLIGDGRDPIPGEVVNPLPWQQTPVFTFDKDITYNHRVIRANENVLEQIDFSKEGLFFPMSFSPWAIQELRFPLERFAFEPGCYQITAQWTTVDNLVLVDTLDVFIDAR